MDKRGPHGGGDVRGEGVEHLAVRGGAEDREVADDNKHDAGRHKVGEPDGQQAVEHAAVMGKNII